MKNSRPSKKKQKVKSYSFYYEYKKRIRFYISLVILLMVSSTFGLVLVELDDNHTIFDFFWTVIFTITGAADFADTHPVSHIGRLIIFFVSISSIVFIGSAISSILGDFVIKKMKLFGRITYKGKDHIIIINSNKKLEFILFEINKKMEIEDSKTDVIIIVEDSERFDRLFNIIDLNNYPYLTIIMKYGNLTRIETVKEVSLYQAKSLIILTDEWITDISQNEFITDNKNIMIISTLMSDKEFSSDLLDRIRKNMPKKCVVEILDKTYTKLILESMTSLNGKDPSFAIVESTEFLSRILSLSIIDANFFKIYEELLGFGGHDIYFIGPALYNKDGRWIACLYKDAHVKFTKGILIGISRKKNDNFNILLNPVDETIQEDDWLICILDDINQFIIDHSQQWTHCEEGIENPSEIFKRKICMIGDTRHLSDLHSFLDKESQESFKTITFTKQDIKHEHGYTDERCFTDDRIVHLFENQLDQFHSIVLNLEDQLAYRFLLFLKCKYGDNSNKVIALLTSPILTDLLQNDEKFRFSNLILSDKIVAQIISQLSFKRSLSKIYDELLRPKGNEINFITVGNGIDMSKYVNKKQLKDALLSNHMSYIGIIDKQGSICFDEEMKLQEAKQIIVLSMGNI
ncbi:MAG: hypothetical protein HQK77_14975 [Desulfobacterales bacterium]|nr:hypothetical protein [Desulfobacterales bacterium]